MKEKLGTVTIAPEVLVTIARLTALKTPGVARLGSGLLSSVNSVLKRSIGDGGVKIEIGENGVSVELHIIAQHDANMLELGQRIQANLSRAIAEMVGMTVNEVNVYIQDVQLPGDEGEVDRESQGSVTVAADRSGEGG
jgi:uncharacterized alkaline shock family protein YloU